MKSAIIGLGGIGKVHLKTLNEIGANIIALCDIDAEKLSLYNGVKHYTNYIEMLDNEEIDVVHVCTPHYLHTEMILECLKRDVNVLCEKPMCIKEEDIAKIIDAENQSKAILGISHQNRYNPANLFVKEYLEGKEIIGAHGSVTWNRDENYYSLSPWRGKTMTEGGGVLINQALHTLDILQWLCDMPEAVSSIDANLTHRGITEVEDISGAIYYGKTNFSFFATVSGGCDMPTSITIQTKDKDNIIVLPQKVIINDQIKTFYTNDKVYGKDCYGSSHKTLFIDFYNAVFEGRPFKINAEEASKVVRMILASYKSKGNKVKI